jgi:hypothetical protein
MHAITTQVYFFSVPSATATTFFAEAAATFDDLVARASTSEEKLEVAALLVTSLQTALDAAQDEKGRQQQFHSTVFLTAIAGVDEPEWTASADVREALSRAAASLARYRNPFTPYAPSKRIVISKPRKAIQINLFWSHEYIQTHSTCRLICHLEGSPAVAQALDLLFAISERVLNSFAAALAALRGLERMSLADEYASVRDSCLTPLLTEAAKQWRVVGKLLTQSAQAHRIRTSTQSKQIFVLHTGEDRAEEWLQRVESLAESHNGYKQLFEICDFLGDKYVPLL